MLPMLPPGIFPDSPTEGEQIKLQFIGEIFLFIRNYIGGKEQ